MSGAVALFTDGADWHAARLERAFARRGVECRRVSLSACGFAVGRTLTDLLLPGFGDSLPSGAFVRVIGQGSFEQVTLRLGVLHALDRLGVPVYNTARAIERCVDKSATSFLLALSGLPTPPSVAVQSADMARAVVENTPDCVLKPLFGAQGRGLRRLSTQTMCRSPRRWPASITFNPSCRRAGRASGAIAGSSSWEGMRWPP